MYWGVIGNIYFIKEYWKSIYDNIKKVSGKNTYLLAFAYIFVFLSIFTYINFEIKYEIWAFVSLIIYIINLNEKI